MGFRQAVALFSVSFCFGILFICYTVDHRLLWEIPLSEESVANGFKFYTTFFNAPPAIKALLHAIMGLGLIAFISKLHKWDDSAKFFDGTCIGVYTLAICGYLTITVPNLRMIVEPLEGENTRADQVEAMRVLSAGNTIIMVLFGAILALQAGQEYARRVEEAVLKEFAEAERRKAAAADGTSLSEKKEQ